jgi:hypothetical protein
MTPCTGCVHYEPNGVKRGSRAYSKCNREGAFELAMQERKEGACGPGATLKNE